MKTLRTARLLLRWPCVDDAEFMLRLLNTPAFLEHIGDRGVRTLDQAREYLRERMLSSFESAGLGMFIVEVAASGASAGVCGLVKREELEDVDIGFAFLPEFWAQGYGAESASAVLGHAKDDLALDRLAAIVSPRNESSIRLLRKLGFAFERKVRMAADEEAIDLYGLDLRL